MSFIPPSRNPIIEEGMRAAQKILEENGIINDNYVSLQQVLDRAYEQASAGKGAERHGQDMPFEQQPMLRISELINSPDGLAYQAIKKIQEQQRFNETDRRVRELLGAINYIAGMIIYIENEEANDE